MRIWLYPVLTALAACGGPSATDLECRGTLLDKSYFKICHDDDWLIAEWVSYTLNASDLDGPATRTNDYRPDPELSLGHRAELADYSGSGYDRGHMAPAEDFTRSTDAISTTFLLSNMAPQTDVLNRGPWMYLESHVRDVVRDRGQAEIVVGNLFLDENGEPVSPSTRIGEDGVAVPTHCFKALLTRANDDSNVVTAYSLPNTDTVGTYDTYEVPIDDLRYESGFDLFSGR